MPVVLRWQAACVLRGARTHALIHTHTCQHAHTYLTTYMHPCTRTYAPMQAHACTHTRTHTHTLHSYINYVDTLYVDTLTV